MSLSDVLNGECGRIYAAASAAMSHFCVRILLSFLILATMICQAQIGQANLRGTVTDSSGAAIPDAKVTVSAVDTGKSRSVVTMRDGGYVISILDPASYRLEVQAPHFRTFVISSLLLHTDENATVDAKLEVGSSTQQVTVTSENPLLVTNTAEVDHLVPSVEVAQLPLDGRKFWELAQLTPGVTFTPQPQTQVFNGTELRAKSVNVTVNGQAYEWTGWSLDGANITNFEIGGTLISPNVDAIEEFTVAAGNMPAEYGHTPNMVNASLKSGTNSFHGDAFEYLRNSVFDARNFFLPAPAHLNRNQFGGTLGGPVLRNRIFFFADYQRTSVREGTPENDVLPSNLERGGVFSDLKTPIIDPLTRLPFTGNVVPVSRISPQANFFLPYIPTPNVLQGGTNRSIFTAPTPLTNDEGDVKLDIRANDANSLMARYSISDTHEFNPNPYPALKGTDLSSSAQNSTLRWTHIFSPTLLNSFQWSYYDSPFLFGMVLPNVNIDAMAGIQGFSNPVITPFQSFPSISLTGYQGFNGSPSDGRPKFIRARDWEWTDNMTYTHGKHELKFGADIMYLKHVFWIGSNDVGSFAFNGQYTSNAFADFLLGYPSSGTRSGFQTTYGVYGTFQAYYLDDTFRLRNNLTLTAGLRFEVNPFYNGIRDTISGFDYATGQMVVPSGIQNVPFVQPLFPVLLSAFQDRILFTDQLKLPQSITPSNHDWAPRLGIAWKPSHKDVVRAGYGIYYTFPDTNIINNTVVSVPFTYVQTLNNTLPPLAPSMSFANFFQGTLAPKLNPNPGTPCSFGLVLNSCDTPALQTSEINLHQQYTQEWNFTIEHQFNEKVALTVGYVGNKTSHLQQFVRRNDPPPGPGAVQSRRPYPQWGTINSAEWGGKANYNALQSELVIREWRDLSLTGSFVYSRCLDDGTDELQAPATQLIGDNYGPCDFNQKYSSSISANYAFPFGTGKRFLANSSAAVRHVVGHWQVAANGTMKSGLPFTPTISTDTANTGVGNQRANVTGIPFVPENVSCWYYTSANPSCVSLYPNGQNAFGVPAQYTYGNGGRNILTGDRFLQLNLAVLREFPIAERTKLQFRAEFFNIFNHPVFSTPGATSGNGLASYSSVNISSGSQVAQTLNSNRLLEFSLKLFF